MANVFKPGGGTFDGGGGSFDDGAKWGSGVSDETVSFVMTNGKTKLAEAAAAVMNIHGSIGSYSKIAQGSKTFEQMHAAIALDRGVVSPNTLPINNGALSDLSDLSTANTESSATASQINAQTGQTNGRSLHKVTLKETGTGREVVFEILPEIVEQHTVEYEALAPPQFPGAFQKYKGNSSTQWQLNAMFVSRTAKEAEMNYRNLLLLRGWTKPFYGKRTSIDHKGKLGAPPPVLMLSGLRNLVGPAPVVITSLNWSWPKDVDYIATKTPGPDGKAIPFPTILSVPIQLVESYSVDQFNQFSLKDYREGNLQKAFNIVELDIDSGIEASSLYTGSEPDKGTLA